MEVKEALYTLVGVGGYVYTLSGVVISWKSRKQSTIALSSTHSLVLVGMSTHFLSGVVISWKSKEAIYYSIIIYALVGGGGYVVLTLATKKGIWIKSMLEDFNLFAIPTMMLFCGNQSCIKLVDYPKMSDNIRHVDF